MKLLILKQKKKIIKDLKAFGIAYEYLLFGKIPIRLKPRNMFVHRTELPKMMGVTYDSSDFEESYAKKLYERSKKIKGFDPLK